MKADFSKSKLLKHAKQYDALSVVDKTLYEFSHAHNLNFCVDSFRAAVSFDIKASQHLKAVLLQMKDVKLLLSMFCFYYKNE